MISWKEYLQEASQYHLRPFGDDPWSCYEYACNVVKGRFPDGEKAIKQNPDLALRYLQKVWKNKWFQMHRYTVKDQLDLLKHPIDDEMLEGLNFLRMKKEVQEALIKKRPDLIGRIENLDPELQEKYGYEDSVSKVEI